MKATFIPAVTEKVIRVVEEEHYNLELSKEELDFLIAAVGCSNIPDRIQTANYYNITLDSKINRADDVFYRQLKQLAKWERK